MDIKKIRNIIDNTTFPDSIKSKLILSVIADDKNAIPYILEILENERNKSKDLLLDTNVELSKALITLKTKKLQKERDSIVNDIKNHYIKWKDYIKCCFKVEGLP